MTYHKFHLQDKIILVIAEPQKKQYIWLSFYLEEDFRNGIISKELIMYALYLLPGVHHIHWLKGITTFRKLAKELGWKTFYNSKIFDASNHSIANNILDPPVFFSIINATIRHKILLKCPPLTTIYSKNDQVQIIKSIKEIYNQR